MLYTTDSTADRLLLSRNVRFKDNEDNVDSLHPSELYVNLYFSTQEPSFWDSNTKKKMYLIYQALSVSKTLTSATIFLH